jgi:two-component system OmpR family sensor kinase
MVGMSGMDITRQKLAERALQEAHDILESKVAERTVELQETMHRLEQAHVQQKKFIADASHDLRTPLTIIRAELELLLELRKDDIALRKSILRTSSGVQRLDKLSSDLLLLTRLDNDLDEKGTNIIRLDELVLDSISNLASFAREKSISWQINIDETIELCCHAASLDRAINNLLDNAIRYSHEGGVVRVSIEETETSAILSISDDGCGIMPEDLPKIFDRFYRGDQARTTGGTGLGLSIVKSVIEAHHGYVSVDTASGAGSTFTISIPLGKVYG